MHFLKQSLQYLPHLKYLTQAGGELDKESLKYFQRCNKPVFPISGNYLKLPERSKNHLVKALSICSGYSGLAGGQYYDLTFEKKNISKKNIINIQKKKTGQLFAFCCESAGFIKEQNFYKRKILKKIGLDIGLLFQITDDLIDFKGDSKIVGKPTKSDKKKGKQTLVKMLGYKETLILQII